MSLRRAPRRWFAVTAAAALIAVLAGPVSAGAATWQRPTLH
jgi:hypothetical protein